MAQPIRFLAYVEHVEHHSKDVVSYLLKSEKRLPRFLPGQFIHLALKKFDPSDFWPDSRVFSVANSVSDRYTLKLTISRQGEFTDKILDTLSEGDIVSAKGPYGEFIIDTNTLYNHIVMIAGGTGVTPFCSFMDFVVNTKNLILKKTNLYYGSQNIDLLIYKSLAEKCSKIYENFNVIYYLENFKQNNSIRLGKLNIEEILNDCHNISDTIFFLSGPKKMIVDFQEILINEKKLNIDQVKIDAWE